jgi:hypothetical protein
LTLFALALGGGASDRYSLCVLALGVSGCCSGLAGLLLLWRTPSGVKAARALLGLAVCFAVLYLLGFMLPAWLESGLLHGDDDDGRDVLVYFTVIPALMALIALAELVYLRQRNPAGAGRRTVHSASPLSARGAFPSC